MNKVRVRFRAWLRLGYTQELELALGLVRVRRCMFGMCLVCIWRSLPSA